MSLLILAGAVALLILAAVLPLPGAGPLRPRAAADAPAVDRPAEVGDPAAESFLREVDRPTGIPAVGRIRVTDDTFSAAYDEIYDHRDKYYGRSIELSGYVDTQDGLAPGSYLLGRRLLWCCEEDAYFIGFLVLGEGVPPEAGSALRVVGRIEAAAYRNPDTGKTFTVPAIRVESVAPAEGVSPRVFPAGS
ncbi:MAG: hypothetical protein JNG85_13920 [Spirochaetaceae bacterium]|nr:hypothetical protein [Spirochaetaceae bacterium]